MNVVNLNEDSNYLVTGGFGCGLDKRKTAGFGYGFGFRYSFGFYVLPITEPNSTVAIPTHCLKTKTSIIFPATTFCFLRIKLLIRLCSNVTKVAFICMGILQNEA